MQYRAETKAIGLKDCNFNLWRWGFLLGFFCVCVFSSGFGLFFLLVGWDDTQHLSTFLCKHAM